MSPWSEHCRLLANEGLAVLWLLLCLPSKSFYLPPAPRAMGLMGGVLLIGAGCGDGQCRAVLGAAGREPGLAVPESRTCSHARSPAETPSRIQVFFKNCSQMYLELTMWLREPPARDLLCLALSSEDYSGPSRCTAGKGNH